MKIIQEETNVDYRHISDLSYVDNGGKFVTLFNNGNLIGKIKVWKDSQEDGREYIALNYEIIYLDTLTKK